MLKKNIITAKYHLQEADRYLCTVDQKSKTKTSTVAVGKNDYTGHDYQDWSVEDWQRVPWRDETKFELFGQKGRIFVRKS